MRWYPRKPDRKSKKEPTPSDQPAGPKRAVGTYGGNYAGYYFSFKGDHTIGTVQWESWRLERVLAWVLERNPRCLRYTDQAEKYLRMCIDYLSDWEDGSQVLHYVKPAKKLLTLESLRQVKLWDECARATGRTLEIAVDRDLSPDERARCPFDSRLFVLPKGIAADNLEFLTNYANPRICPPGFRDDIRRLSNEGGPLSLRSLATRSRRGDFEPLHPLYHLVFVGDLQTDEDTALVGPDSIVRWVDGRPLRIEVIPSDGTSERFAYRDAG
jgi:hypothetical protein